MTWSRANYSKKLLIIRLRPLLQRGPRKAKSY